MRATDRRLSAMLVIASLTILGAACEDEDPAAVESPTPTADASPSPDETEDGTDASPDDTDDPAVATGGTIEVGDQIVTDGLFVTIDRATIEGGPGFVVVRVDVDGGPGPVLGHTAIEEGTSDQVQVKLDQPVEGEISLWAVLQADVDGDRMLDFPDGQDEAVMVDGEPVQEYFDASTV